jgi:glucose dehydrogenase
LTSAIEGTPCWEVSGEAVALSYQVASGKQFVVIAVGGGEEFGVGDYLVAFALP